MTTTPPETPPAPGPDTTGGPRVTTDQMRDLTRLRRSVTDRKIAGVAGGLGRHLDVDPTILRVAFVVLAIFGGAGLLLYGAAWLVVPDEGRDRAPIDLEGRNRSFVLIGVGIIAALMTVGDAWGGWGLPWPLVALVVIAVVYFSNRSSRTERVSLDKHAAWPPPGTPVGVYGGPASPPVPPVQPVVPPTFPRRVRKPGPILFWFTLMLLPLGLGLLGLAEAGGLTVADSAYPALAVTIIGAMLLLSAFWGRGGGLILIGLLASLVLAGTAATESWDGRMLSERPGSASEVEDSYFVPAGELTLDLTGVQDLESLDGRHIEVGAGAGRIEVVVPRTIDVTVDAEIGGPGELRLFDELRSGINVRDRGFVDGGEGDVPDIDIHIFNGIGEIEVTQR